MLLLTHTLLVHWTESNVPNLCCLLSSVPDSPHEPDPEPYEPMPPRLIPLDEVSSLQTPMAARNTVGVS